MFVPGRITAQQMRAELGTTTFFAGQKVRPSQLGDLVTVRQKMRAQRLNELFPGGSIEPPPPPPDGVPAHPGEALWIGSAGGQNHFNVGIGQGTSSDTNHDDFSQAQIATGFEQANRFFLTEALGQYWTELRINAGAGKTSQNTKFPRSELREYLQNGTTKAAWNGSTGLHYQRATERVTAVGQQRPWVCFWQIHDASSDLVRLQTEGSAGQTTNLDLVARYTKNDSETRVVLRGGYDLGDVIDVYGEVNNGTLRIELDDVEELVVTGMGVSGCYFKAGCYMQSNVVNYGESPTRESAVQILAGSLEVWHTGYPDPTDPVFTG